jgi:hypothetical protein
LAGFLDVFFLAPFLAVLGEDSPSPSPERRLDLRLGLDVPPLSPGMAPKGSSSEPRLVVVPSLEAKMSSINQWPAGRVCVRRRGGGGGTALAQCKRTIRSGDSVSQTVSIHLTRQPDPWESPLWPSLVEVHRNPRDSLPRARSGT